jgi:hypothetical protein
MTGMRRITAIGAGIVVAGLLTHGILYGGKDLSTGHPVFSYAGLSQRALLAVNQRWNHAHGLPSEMDCWNAVDRDAGRRRLVDVSLNAPGDFPAGAVCDSSHSHTPEFLRFLIFTLRLVAPTIGFAIFLLLERRKPGLQLWRPITIVIVAIGLPHWGLWAEVARAGIVTLAMIGSVALFADTKRRENAV